MTVTVHYTAQSRAAAGTDQERVELPPGASPLDLLMVVSGRHGEALGRIVLDAGRPRPAAAVFVNGAQVDWSSPRALSDGDELLILSPIFGG